MILDSMAWFDEEELEEAGFTFVKDKCLILRSKKKGSDQFGWGEKADIVMSDYDPNKNYWGVPRAWPELVEYTKREWSHIWSPNFTEVPKDYKYVGPKLRDDQKECVKQSYEHLTVEDGWQQYFPGGIIMAPAGTGKTLMALDLIAKLGQKALIIVHKEILMKQWMEQIKTCLGSETKVGRIQGDSCQSNWGDICVGMVQSLSSRDYTEAYNNFGIVIVDEVHRLGATEWHKAIKHFPAKYRVGLTATPKRADGFADVFKWHIGPVMARLDKARMEPKIIFRSHTSGLKQKSYTYKKKVNLGRLTTRLAQNTKRNKRIANLAIQAIDKGRRPLILSDRVDQVETIASLLLGKGKFVRIYHSKTTIMKKAVGLRKDQSAEPFDAVVGTYQMVKEGVDIPRLDTLIYATPKVDVEQAVGRILRDHPDKKEPLVVDIVDENLPILKGFAEGRRKRYIEAYGEDCIIEVGKKKSPMDHAMDAWAYWNTNDLPKHPNCRSTIVPGDLIKSKDGNILGRALSADDKVVTVKIQGDLHTGSFLSAQYDKEEVSKA